MIVPRNSGSSSPRGLDVVPEPVVVCWSGGKDSALALYEILNSAHYRVTSLMTTVTEGYERISMHGVRVSLLERQAEALGLPLEQVRIPREASNAIYEASMEQLLMRHRDRGIRKVVFGDLFLEDIRRYRETHLGTLNMEGVFPLWMMPTRDLASRLIESGFHAVLVCIDPKQLDPGFCGREFDDELLKDLPASCDPCGERGEFHTFVYDGPIFRFPVAISRGEVVHRDGFWFCDLAPPDGSR